MDKRTNEQVLGSMNKKRSLIKTIWDRKKNWIGHAVRERWSDEIGAGRENGRKVPRKAQGEGQESA